MYLSKIGGWSWFSTLTKSVCLQCISQLYFCISHFLCCQNQFHSPPSRSRHVVFTSPCSCRFNITLATIRADVIPHLTKVQNYFWSGKLNCFLPHCASLCEPQVGGSGGTAFRSGCTETQMCLGGSSREFFSLGCQRIPFHKFYICKVFALCGGLCDASGKP